MILPSGIDLKISIGRPTILSMLKARCAITTLVRVDTKNRKKILQQLLRENHQDLAEADSSPGAAPGTSAAMNATPNSAANATKPGEHGVELPSSNQVRSSETYVGYDRAKNAVIHPEVAEDETAMYTLETKLQLNQWSLGGRWHISAESAQVIASPGKIAFRFHARDLHLVLGSEPSEKSVRFIVRIDGAKPGPDHGMDIDEAGQGVIQEHRLYQLIRQDSEKPIEDRTFEIEFLDSGAQAFAFTFG